MKDDDFKLLRGFDNGQTNRRTDICDCRVAFATENLGQLFIFLFSDWGRMQMEGISRTHEESFTDTSQTVSTTRLLLIIYCVKVYQQTLLLYLTIMTWSRSDKGKSSTVFSSCSSTQHPVILSGQSNNLWVEFKSGHKSVSQGFQLTVLSVQGKQAK